MAPPFQSQQFVAAHVREIPRSGIREFFELVAGDCTGAAGTIHPILWTQIGCGTHAGCVTNSPATLCTQPHLCPVPTAAVAPPLQQTHAERVNP